ncbi:hypothetical protein KJ855_01810 [Patescibacteria group bacterium]|nr:hypothetical protein [Patescibacteria group bacterium]
MEYDLLLIGGGRTRRTRERTGLAMKSINQVLGGELRVGMAHIDEHGRMWHKSGEHDQFCALVGGKMFYIDSDEMVIGLDQAGFKINRAWPLFYGGEFAVAGIVGMLEFAGLQMVGSEGWMCYISNKRELAKSVINCFDFDADYRVITKEEWEREHVKLDDEICKSLDFPVFLKTGDVEQIVSSKMNFENMVFDCLENSDCDEVRVRSKRGLVDKLMVGFVGGKNFLPSRICVKQNGNMIEFDKSRTLVREVQDRLIGFVRNFDVKDLGLLEINLYEDRWVVERIDLFPLMNKEGDFAKIWNISGMNYTELVKKIYNGLRDL